ncbi:MAG: N-glycosylase/DNA lyase [Candidatus Diapherotrites archaeon]|nr:N-glycosylase/DNA lyase [Candidatus Diapherotrites archaeon]
MKSNHKINQIKNNSKRVFKHNCETGQKKPLKEPLKLNNTCIASPHINSKIKQALTDFSKIWSSEEKVYEELCFCLLTPQSSAKQAMKTITLLKEHHLLDRGGAQEKEIFLKNVRFYRTKALRLVEAQKRFPSHKIKQILQENGLPNDAIKCREFLLKEVNGYGMKEASHFLRNIGFGKEIAILDRHILKNLKTCEVLVEIPKTLTKKRYLEIEEKMKQFCKKQGIPFDELDLIFWSNETGDVLK